MDFIERVIKMADKRVKGGFCQTADWEIGDSIVKRNGSDWSKSVLNVKPLKSYPEQGIDLLMVTARTTGVFDPGPHWEIWGGFADKEREKGILSYSARDENFNELHDMLTFNWADEKIDSGEDGHDYIRTVDYFFLAKVKKTNKKRNV